MAAHQLTHETYQEIAALADQESRYRKISCRGLPSYDLLLKSGAICLPFVIEDLRTVKEPSLWRREMALELAPLATGCTIYFQPDLDDVIAQNQLVEWWDEEGLLLFEELHPALSPSYVT